MFPEWLRREMEFRQLVNADPSMLERRREEAASWIKQEVSVGKCLLLGVWCCILAKCKKRHAARNAIRPCSGMEAASSPHEYESAVSLRLIGKEQQQYNNVNAFFANSVRSYLVYEGDSALSERRRFCFSTRKSPVSLLFTFCVCCRWGRHHRSCSEKTCPGTPKASVTSFPERSATSNTVGMIGRG